jgi:hypothetical protein
MNRTSSFSNFSYFTEYFTDYFQSEWSFAFKNFDEFKNIPFKCCFDENNDVILVTSNGYYLRVSILVDTKDDKLLLKKVNKINV